MIVVSPAALACIVASVVMMLGTLTLLVASFVVAAHGLALVMGAVRRPRPGGRWGDTATSAPVTQKQSM